jgi:flavodoxin
MQEASVQKSGQKSGIVVFDTKFGNTEKIAKSIAAGLERAGVAVKCIGMSEAHPETLKGYDLIVVGAPTQAFTASKPMKEFIDRLEDVSGLAGKNFYAFDTKLPSRFSGSAARYIESKLERKGLRPAGPRSSAIGRGSVFKLDDGEEKRFELIGFELGANLTKSS